MSNVGRLISDMKDVWLLGDWEELAANQGRGRVRENIIKGFKNDVGF